MQSTNNPGKMPEWLYYCDPVELATLAYGTEPTVVDIFETFWYLQVCPVAEA